MSNILAGRMADGTALSDREYKAVLEQGASRIGYIDFTFSAPKSLSVAWAFAPTNAERAMLHQAHRDAIESVLRTIEKEIGRAEKAMAARMALSPARSPGSTFDHYAARPTVEVVRQDEQGSRSLNCTRSLARQAACRATCRSIPMWRCSMRGDCERQGRRAGSRPARWPYPRMGRALPGLSCDITCGRMAWRSTSTAKTRWPA